MIYLILGLVIFLGAHSVRIVADDWRTQTIERIGLNAWKGWYTLISLLGFGLIVWGYGQARATSAWLYVPPAYMNHVAVLLMLFSFILLVATYVPANHIKTAVGHPMAASVKVWAFAHLLCNGRVADVVLFGAFLVWAVAVYTSARRRDRLAGVQYPAAVGKNTLITIICGLVTWLVFIFWAHQWLIGVSPLAIKG